ncbi:hypothetical protein [Algoriphagus sp.]|uniref:hypothetical protein n=1 Tax=Algoriphagus sp. TaxID=1872435 RepID=UPI002613A0E4|nr:hypothetical protein [Algoriphagus sp.]
MSLLATILLGICVFAKESSAQTEQEKVEMEPLKPLDRPIVEDHATSQEVIIPKVVVTQKTKNLPTQNTPIRRELILGEEGKKTPEPVSSTLSFNIFLYVVDKFKAD